MGCGPVVGICEHAARLTAYQYQIAHHKSNQYAGAKTQQNASSYFNLIFLRHGNKPSFSIRGGIFLWSAD